MTPNRSLELSVRIRELMREDLLQFLEPIFPFEALRSYESGSSVRRRDRVYNSENTLLTMVVTALYEDRSLQNSVRLFQEIFQKSRERVLACALDMKHKLEAQRRTSEPGRGRPRSTAPRIPVSKIKDVSANTAAFSKARDRLEQGLIDRVFAASRDTSDLDCVSKWHDRLVFNTDGTYIQLQDTDQIPQKYRVQKSSDGTPQGYPQALVHVLTQHGSGFLSSYRIAGRNQSELDVFPSMLDDLPAKSVVLADDLYNCYSLFCLFQQRSIDIIVPDKKGRSYRVLKELSPGDEIVEILKPHQKIRLRVPEQLLPPRITLRRISYKDPEHPTETRVLLTTIMDQAIERHEFIHTFSTRWDVEISIREIKTIMGINIARSKSEHMVFREIAVALLAYNLVRKIGAESTRQTIFSPETDIFQKLYSTYTDPLVDRKGRVYSRWSPGRPPARSEQNRGTPNPRKTRKTVSEKNQSGKVPQIQITKQS